MKKRYQLRQKMVDARVQTFQRFIVEQLHRKSATRQILFKPNLDLVKIKK